jgi:tetraacyldisaccharide 4'-kinase
MNRAATLALTPLSGIYGALVKARNALYHRGVLRAHQVNAPVISVGNLTTGGTGKTPLVQWIASELAQNGLRVCVLTRGYGRKTSGRVIVSDGHKILADVNQAGDEAFLLAEKLTGQAAVICDADRVAAARWAIENLRSDVFVLDDAFQHQRIARNLNIVTIDATNPWGNGRLLPSGVLREPVKELARADCIVITHADRSDGIEDLREQIARLCGGIAVFLSQTKQTRLRPLVQDESSTVPGPSVPIAAFCAIGNPESFFALLRRAGYQLTHPKAFRDHHHYTQSDIDRIAHDARAHGAQALVTTAKDAVKARSLSFDLPCYVAEIAIEIDRQKQFLNLILKAIRSA